jgi:hypothetical protein
LAQLDSDGKLIWAEQIKSVGGGVVSIWAIVCGPSAVYVTGYFSSDTQFGTGANAVILKSSVPGLAQMFVAAYSLSGEFLWASQTDSPSQGVSSAVNIGYGIDYADGSLYIAGALETVETIFGPGANTFTLTKPNKKTCGFLASYDAATGDFNWVRIATSDFYGSHFASVRCRGDDIWVTGGYSGTLLFPAPAVPYFLPAVSGSPFNAVVARYKATGVLIDAWKVASDLVSDSNSIAASSIDVDGDFVYVSGHVAAKCLFGEGLKQKSVPDPESSSEQTAYLAKFDHDGGLNWIAYAGTHSNNIGRTSVVGPSHEVYFSLKMGFASPGYASRLVDSKGTAVQLTTPGAGVFIAQFDQDGILVDTVTGIVDQNDVVGLNVPYIVLDINHATGELAVASSLRGDLSCGNLSLKSSQPDNGDTIVMKLSS